MAKIKIKRERVKFASDNVAGACPEVLDAMKKVREAVHARGRLMSEDVESGINFVQWVPSKLSDWLEEKKSGK